MEIKQPPISLDLPAGERASELNKAPVDTRCRRSLNIRQFSLFLQFRVTRPKAQTRPKQATQRNESFINPLECSVQMPLGLKEDAQGHEAVADHLPVPTPPLKAVVEGRPE